MLTTLEAAEGEPAATRGFLRIGAATVARHQASLALALECQLIVCIARSLSPELIELQHAAEKAGARFQLISGARSLASLVTANDDVFVIGDGLLASTRTACELLETGQSVLVLPVESGTAAGFERVDINHASAGMMRIPGRLIEQLNELPPDCDITSALTRIALQAGIGRRELPPGVRDGLDWVLIRNEEEAHRIEAGWIALQVSNDGPLTAGAMLARLGVKSIGPALLHAGSGGNALAIASLVVAMLAMGAGFAGFAAIALVCCGVAWVARRTSSVLLRIERESLGLAPDRWSLEAVFGWILDAAIVAIVAWSPQNEIWAHAGERIFGPLMLVCVLRLAPRVHGGQWVAWLGDRAVWAIVLASASGAGVLIPAVQLLAAGLALFAIVYPLKPVRLT